MGPSFRGLPLLVNRPEQVISDSTIKIGIPRSCNAARGFGNL